MINSAYAEKVYFKIVGPSYTSLKINKQNNSKFTEINSKLQTNASIYLGYHFLRNIDLEISFSTHNYYLRQMNRVSSQHTHRVTTPSNINHNLFAFAFDNGPDNDPFCWDDLGVEGFKTKKQICNSANISHNLFAFAFDNGQNNDPFCWDDLGVEGFKTKEQICGTSTTVTTTNTQQTNISVSSRMYTLVPAVRFKPPLLQTKLFTPYISAGAGIAISRNKISRSFSSGAPTQLFTNTTKALALEFGIGTHIHITRRISLDIEAKYFNYGTHEFIPGSRASINGYRIGGGLTFFF